MCQTKHTCFVPTFKSSALTIRRLKYSLGGEVQLALLMQLFRLCSEFEVYWDFFFFCLTRISKSVLLFFFFFLPFQHGKIFVLKGLQWCCLLIVNIVWDSCECMQYWSIWENSLKLTLNTTTGQIYSWPVLEIWLSISKYCLSELEM